MEELWHGGYNVPPITCADSLYAGDVQFAHGQSKALSSAQSVMTQQSMPTGTAPTTENFLSKIFSSVVNWVRGKKRPDVDRVIRSYVDSCRNLSESDETAVIAEMLIVLSHQVKSKQDSKSVNDDEICQLRQQIAGLEDEQRRAVQEMQELQRCLDMEREHKITVGTMAGVFQKTAEQDVLEGLITSYFADDLHSFVSEFQHLTREEVFDLEDNIMKKLTASFDQGRSILVSHIVRLCRNQITHDDTCAAYYEVVTGQGQPEYVVKQFLSAEVYARARNQTLSEDDWNQRKAVIFLKSVFFNSTDGESFLSNMEEVVRENFAFVFKAPHSGKISEPAVNKFLSVTVTLLQQMLKSESAIIPWTGLENYDPLFMEVDARQPGGQIDDPMDEDRFKEWKIGGYKRPILLSCNHCKVKIGKGKVWLEEPK